MRDLHDKDAFSWVDRMERYFDIQGIPEDQWLYVAKVAMEGKALGFAGGKKTPPSNLGPFSRTPLLSISNKNWCRILFSCCWECAKRVQ